MRILKSVYTTEYYKYRAADTKQKLRRHEKMPRLYLVVINRARGNRIEFFRSDELLQPCYPETDLIIAGFAESKTKARELLVRITDDALEKRSNVDLAAFLLDNAEVIEL